MSTLSPERLAPLLDLGAVRAERARRGLLAFTQATYPAYRPGWHHRRLCHLLDRMARGECRRAVVSMPPRHGKTELVSRRFPARLLGLNPDNRVIAASYSAALASRINRDVQRIVDSDEYRRIFPGTRLASGKNPGSYQRNSDLFEVVGSQGTYRSAGVGGGITGMGGDFLIVDDPIKNREEADSPTQREAVWEWFTSTLYTRQEPGASILVCMTRWNQDDLAGRLLRLQDEDASADRWEVLRLPAIADDSPGPGDPRKPGEALWPERYPLDELGRIKASVGGYEWAALYQQDPRGEGGTEWPDSYFGPGVWFDEWPSDLQIKTMALDPSKGKDARHGDYSAYVLLGRDADGVLWCEGDLAHRTAERIVEDGVEHCRVWKPDVFGVESNVFQELLINLFQALARKQMVFLPVRGLTNMVNKQVRIRRLGPYLAQGQVRFRNTPGTRLLVRQLKEFPVGSHDDGPDALEMALRIMIEAWNGRQKGKPKRYQS